MRVQNMDPEGPLTKCKKTKLNGLPHVFSSTYPRQDQAVRACNTFYMVRGTCFSICRLLRGATLPLIMYPNDGMARSLVTPSKRCRKTAPNGHGSLSKKT